MGTVHMDITYEFRENGTYSYINAVTGQRTDGDYEVSGNRIIFPRINNAANFGLNGNTLSLDYGSSSQTLYLERRR